MTERLSGRAILRCQKEKPSKPLSFAMSAHALKQADVRAYINVFGGDPEGAVVALTQLRIHGRDIEAQRAISHGLKTTRLKATETILSQL